MSIFILTNVYFILYYYLKIIGHTLRPTENGDRNMKDQHPQDMEPQDIRAELTRNRIAQTAIARKLEVSPSTVNKVIDGFSVSDRIRKAIAAAIGKDVTDIWPTYYQNGGPKRPGRPLSPDYQPN